MGSWGAGRPPEWDRIAHQVRQIYIFEGENFKNWIKKLLFRVGGGQLKFFFFLFYTFHIVFYVGMRRKFNLLGKNTFTKTNTADSDDDDEIGYWWGW